jgi:hypothetical protein
MTSPQSFKDVVVPAQVWGTLTQEARAQAIELMARVASNLVTHGSDSLIMEISACHYDTITPRSAPNISTVTP